MTLFGVLLPPHDRQPHSEGQWTPGCPRCEAAQRAVAMYLRTPDMLDVTEPDAPSPRARVVYNLLGCLVSLGVWSLLIWLLARIIGGH